MNENKYKSVILGMVLFTLIVLFSITKFTESDDVKFAKVGLEECPNWNFRQFFSTIWVKDYENFTKLNPKFNKNNKD